MAENFGTREPPRATPLWRGLRASEKIALAFFLYTTLHGLASLELHERAILASLNVLVGIVIVVLSMERLIRAAPLSRVIRDWQPCALIVLAYRESGLFLLPDVTHSLDFMFIPWDRAILQNSWVRSLIAFASPWLERFFELSYLLTYPFVPLGVAAGYFPCGAAAAPGHPATAR